MKKMKWAVLFAALVSVFGFSSCLESEKGDTYDLYEYVTIRGTGTSVTMKGDVSGCTFIPTSTDVLAALELKEGGYYKRALVAMKLAEAYVANQPSYKVSAVQVYSYLPYKSVNIAPDTLDTKGHGDYKFLNLGTGQSKPWVSAGFVNVNFEISVPTSTPSLDDFHLYVTGASNDTLYTKLRYVKDNTSAYTSINELVSFEIPSSVMYNPSISNVLNKDSIVLTVVAVGSNGELKSSTDKFHRKELANY